MALALVASEPDLHASRDLEAGCNVRSAASSDGRRERALVMTSCATTSPSRGSSLRPAWGRVPRGADPAARRQD